MAKEKVKKAEAKVAEGKSQALDLAIAQISKEFGEGSIMKLGENHKVDVELLSSGALSLDIALGGGYPKGRIIEIYGPESSGKTTLALHAIATRGILRPIALIELYINRLPVVVES
jgi:recombination protein RecA